MDLQLITSEDLAVANQNGILRVFRKAVFSGGDSGDFDFKNTKVQKVNFGAKLIFYHSPK